MLEHYTAQTLNADSVSDFANASIVGFSEVTLAIWRDKACLVSCMSHTMIYQ